MSEYQYYEFLAIDRPLTSAQMDAVREFSTRAEITSTSFVNEYHWGDFRGDEKQFLQKYYDAFLYYANWGTHRFMLRLPADAIDFSMAKAYFQGDDAEITKSGNLLILDWSSQDEDGDDEEGDAGDMASLSAVRADLLLGDLRPLYIGWLCVAASGELEDDEIEPPVPAGLGDLSAGQKALAQFLRVDDDWLEAAARNSAPRQAGASDAEFAAWVAALPQEDKDALLQQFVAGEGQPPMMKLKREFLASRPAEEQASPRRRTVGELRAEVERLEAERERISQERAAREKARKQAEQLEARAAHLAKLAARQPAAWTEVEALVASKQPKKYGEAVTLLKDLRDLAIQEGNIPRFASRVAALLERHAKKPSFHEKVSKAGITTHPTEAC